MAKVQNPLMSTEASGSFSGMTFSTGRFGSLVKAKPCPVRRVRNVQPTNRAILSYLSRLYGSLTQAQVDQWKGYADSHRRTDVFGNSYTLSPSQQYQSLNHQAIRLFGVDSEELTPPAVDPPAQMITLVGSDGAATGTVTLTWTVLGTGDASDACEVQVSEMNQSLVRTAEIQKYKSVGTVTGVTLTMDVEDLLAEAWYWFRARYVDLHGQVTPWLYAQWMAPTVA